MKKTYETLETDDLYMPEHRKYKNDTDLYRDIKNEIEYAVNKENGFMQDYIYPIRDYSVDWTKNEVIIFFTGLPDG